MKIAYVTTYDSSDIHAWSGLGLNIKNCLKGAGFSVVGIGGLQQANSRVTKIKQRIYKKLSQRYLTNRDPRILKAYARQVEQQLQSLQPDLIFSPGTIPISYLNTNYPIVFWTDATFVGMIDYYQTYTRLCHESIRAGNKMEQQALSKAKFAIYASHWAAKTAIENYQVDPNRVKVIPFGANVECDRTLEDIKTTVKAKSFDRCKLLFCGVDWFRKGGDVALNVAKVLNQMGLPTELSIVGCKPPHDVPDFVKVYGFISKKDKLGKQQIDQFFSDSHFLILPSRAECFGLVFAEASSFGLPSISSNTGGISTVNQDGVSGQTFSIEDPPEKYAHYIKSLMESQQSYRKLALSAFETFHQSFAWSVAGKRILSLLQAMP
ncbi:glycosyltransferase family 4 protein [Nodosilinea sp. LEGE 07088]|uniref:glycosyltransferase family 4 protein n=1 Tax=Nodosilinea sp. LEGE 07088 TaxID=2777968 RepID=UPI001881E1CF|nr:glycosyltransferase family 4 protein [Nodosilinea sp. LEGE 07088]MBE9139430.1 glycosyltransferase family 4 protein [Nodosilinea sp. LEGE 07088]